VSSACRLAQPGLKINVWVAAMLIDKIVQKRKLQHP
jgi:hypothetical protein